MIDEKKKMTTHASSVGADDGQSVSKNSDISITTSKGEINDEVVNHQESPEECLLREVKEETGYTLESWKYRGIVTFVYGEDIVEYMSLYTADRFSGEEIPCDEGELEWVDKEKIMDLNLWDGDKIFLKLLAEEHPFFSLKLVYDTNDVLIYAALDGKELERKM